MKTETSSLLTDNASSLAIHKNDANVFRPVQTEGGIKFERSQRYYYLDTGYETSSLSAYDSTIQKERNNLDKFDKIERLQFGIADTKQTLKTCDNALRRLALQKYLAKLESKLRRLVCFDLEHNRKVTSRYVALHNYETRRPYQQKQYERAEREYAKTLALANICNVCHLPLKTDKLQIVEIIASTRQRELLTASIGRAFEKAVNELVQFEIDSSAKSFWASLKAKGLRKYKDVRFKHVKVTNTDVAEIATHYRAFKFTDSKGQVKLYYGLIDGTTYNGKLLPMKQVDGRLGQKAYVSIPDMLPLDGQPVDAYRVRDVKCECKID